MLIINKTITLEEATKILKDNIEHLDYEEIHISQGMNRVLGENILSTINNPPFDKSPYDGYALRSKDTLKVNDYKEINLEVIEEVFAGQWPMEKITCGKATRIMTGAPIPLGADCVIMQEKVIRNGKEIKVKDLLRINENICTKGEDITEGEVIVQKGKTIDYSKLGIISSTGVNKVKVIRKPVIGILTTGDEVIEPGLELPLGKIYNSNGYLLKGRLEELGYKVLIQQHCVDSIENIAKNIEKIINNVDLLITTGGVSVGDKDYLNRVIEELGYKKLFWKISIKPGSAVLCSMKNNKVILSLSGNPTAAMTTFELLGRYILYLMENKEELKIIKRTCILKGEFNKRSPNRRFLRGKIHHRINGDEVEITQFKKGNGLISSLIDSNCLIDIESGNIGLKNSEKVNIFEL